MLLLVVQKLGRISTFRGNHNQVLEPTGNGGRDNRVDFPACLNIEVGSTGILPVAIIVIVNSDSLRTRVNCDQVVQFVIIDVRNRHNAHTSGCVR